MSRHRDTGIKPSQSMEEHRQRRDKCLNSEPLKDGQQYMTILPAFDLRSTKDSKYGQHSAELIFTKRKGDLIVSISFYTGWSVSGQRTIMDGEDIGFMCTGFYFHYRSKKAANSDYARKSEDCTYSGGTCWGIAGSAVYGDTILDRLVNEGSAGVWDEIEKALKEESPE